MPGHDHPSPKKEKKGTLQRKANDKLPGILPMHSAESGKERHVRPQDDTPTVLQRKADDPAAEESPTTAPESYAARIQRMHESQPQTQPHTQPLIPDPPKPKLKPAPKTVQPKLEIGAPDDALEKEADKVADQVMQMKSPEVSAAAEAGDGADSGQGGDGGSGSSNPPNIQPKLDITPIQRKACPSCGGTDCGCEETIQREAESEEEGVLMRKGEGGAMETTPAFNSALSSTKGTGSSLPGGTRSFMESRMGQDFSDVSVHTGATADTLSRGINARAFTHGSDIYFRSGQWSPNTDGGQRLLAHELTHVAQQGGGVHAKVMRSKDDNPDWVIDAIAYNTKHLRMEARAYYIKMLYEINQHKTLRDEAFAEPGFGTKFAYLVKSAQRVLFKGKDPIPVVYATDGDGKLGPRTFSRMIGFETPAGTSAYQAASYYNHFTYKLDYDGAEVQKLRELLNYSLGWPKSARFPDQAIASGYAQLQYLNMEAVTVDILHMGYFQEGGLEILEKAEKARVKKEQERFADIPPMETMGGLDQPSLTVSNTMIEVSNQYADPAQFTNKWWEEDEWEDEFIRKNAPVWLQLEVQEVVDKIPISKVKAAVHSHTRTVVASNFAEEQAAGEKANDWLCRLTSKREVITAYGGKETQQFAKDNEYGNAMIDLIFSDALNQRYMLAHRDEFVSRSRYRVKVLGKYDMDAWTVGRFSHTASQYYKAAFGKRQQDEMDRFNTLFSAQIKQKSENEIANRQAQIDAKYSGELEKALVEIQDEYEPQLLGALKINVPAVDRLAPAIRLIQLEKGYELNEEQQKLQDEMLKRIDEKIAEISSKYQKDLEFELSEIRLKYQRSYSEGLRNHVDKIKDSIIVPTQLLEESYARIKKAKADDIASNSPSWQHSFALQNAVSEEWINLMRRLMNLWWPSTPTVTRTKGGYITADGMFVFDSFGMEDWGGAGDFDPFEPIETKPAPKKPKHQVNLPKMELFPKKSKHDLMFTFDFQGDGEAQISYHRPNEFAIAHYRMQEYLHAAEIEYYNYVWSRELVDEYGQLNMHGIKAWASEKEEQAIIGFSKAKARGDDDAVDAYVEAYDYMFKIATMPEYRKDFWDEFGVAMAHTNPLYIIPFVGAIVEIVDLDYIRRVANKYGSDPNSLHDGEGLMIEAYAQLQEISKMNKSMGYSVGSTVIRAIPFMIEFIATFGIAGAVKTAVTGVATRAIAQGAKTMIGRALQKMIKFGIKTGLVRGIATAAGAFAQSILNPQAYFRGAFQKMVPQFIVYNAHDGLHFRTDDDKRITWFQAFKDAIVENFFEFWTEHLGAFLMRLPKTILGRIFRVNRQIADAVFVNWMVKQGILKPAMLNLPKSELLTRILKQSKHFRSILAKRGIGNIPEEYLEEFVNARLVETYHGKRWQINSDQELETLISVSLISGPMMVAGGIRSGIDAIRHRGTTTLRIPVRLSDGTIAQQDLRFDSELIESLENFAAESTEVDLAGAAEIIDQHYGFELESEQNQNENQNQNQNQNENQNESENQESNGKRKHSKADFQNKSLLLSYYTQLVERIDLVRWAYETRGEGNLELAYALITLASGAELERGMRNTLRTQADFEAVADVLDMMRKAGTHVEVAKRIRQLLGDHTLTNEQRIALAEQLLRGLQANGRTMTLIDLAAERSISNTRQGLNEDLRPTLDMYRLPGESGTSFYLRLLELQASGTTVAQFIAENKELIENYRLQDNAYAAFVSSQQQRPAVAAFDPHARTHYPQQQQSYATSIESAAENTRQSGNTEQADLLDALAEVEALATAGEVNSALEGYIYEMLFHATVQEAVQNSGNKSLIKKFEKNKNKMIRTMLDAGMFKSKKRKRMSGYSQKIQNAFEKHGLGHLVDFAEVNASIEALIEFQEHKRYFINSEGKIKVGEEFMTPEELAQKIEEVNRLMEFNGMPQRYQSKTRTVMAGAEQWTEVIVTSSVEGHAQPVTINQTGTLPSGLDAVLQNHPHIQDEFLDIVEDIADRNSISEHQVEQVLLTVDPATLRFFIYNPSLLSEAFQEMETKAPGLFLNKSGAAEWLNDYVTDVKSQPEWEGHTFEHLPSSLVTLLESIPHGAFMIGNFEADLKYIIDELNYTLIENVDMNFPVPPGEKFNLLNVSIDAYNYYAERGGFFTLVNGPWIDAAVREKRPIIVVTDMSSCYAPSRVDGKLVQVLTGFGKEVHRLEWKHNYRFDPKTRQMVPPELAGDLPTWTRKKDYTHK